MVILGMFGWLVPKPNSSVVVGLKMWVQRRRSSPRRYSLAPSEVRVEIGAQQVRVLKAETEEERVLRVDVVVVAPVEPSRSLAGTAEDVVLTSAAGGWAAEW